MTTTDDEDQVDGIVSLMCSANHRWSTIKAALVQTSCCQIVKYVL
jgi:hypothetical protein